MSYKELNKEKVFQNEHQVRLYWDDIHLLQQTMDTRKDGEKMVFYEGPPTANGRPGIHHVISRTLKDSVLRYHTMNGYYVRRKAGWDTHGLPVEIEVEKKLGLKNKQDIEAFGIAKFNDMCRESVFEYEDLWKEMTGQMGYLIDLEHPYITLNNDYVESVWWILDKFHKEGLIYNGHKILPYCTRCGTGLASHEVAQGYKEINTTSIYVKFKRTDGQGFFLVWTTTPWTLPSNVALAVNPNELYCKVAYDNTYYFLQKDLVADVFGEDTIIIEEILGKNLEGIGYERLYDYAPVDKKAFYVVCADYVTVEDGTGIVHIAPAFGEDDYQTGVRYQLPVLQPVTLEGEFKNTPWDGKFVIDTDPEIIEDLKSRGLLFKKQKMAHNYPHCWRCNTPLLYYAKQSWFIEMTKLKDQLIEQNNQVQWFPPYVGEKRFGHWLENLNDWAISRSRYWGTPLNIWTCECGETVSVGSRKELKELAIESIDENIELHRPHVDHIHLTCPSCGKPMHRVPDVIDCWFDSGSMPFAQYHYPFENKELFESEFPANFICEGIDQTRGWFYSLLAISTFVMGKSPYKKVLVNDMILDKNGKKMSKSVGNIVNVFELFQEVGADAARWFLLYASPAWNPTKFNKDDLLDICTKFFGTLKNIYNFFTLYANTDGINASTIIAPIDTRSELDRWLLSKLNHLVQKVRVSMESLEHMKAVRAIQDFVVEDFSNWYIRRSRRRFWGSEMSKDKKAVYRTTYEALTTVAQLIAPFAPYISEEIYRNLTGEQSVHLSDFPVCDESLLSERTEKRMDLVKEIVRLGRSARESEKLKVRQPLGKAILDGRNQSLISDLSPLIMEELNVKEVVFEMNLPTYMAFTLKPNFKVLGPVLGSKIGAFSAALAKLNQGEAAMKLESGESVEVLVDDEKITVSKEDVMINIKAKPGFCVRLENNQFIILDTQLTEPLLQEGYARELVSKVQQMRKNNDFEISDHISIYYHGDAVIQEAVESYQTFIMQETLADEMTFEKHPESEGQHLNGKQVELYITKG